MGTRLELQKLFEQILGSRNVYFNPPESVKMEYPAIKYSRDDIRVQHADNLVYRKTNRYQVVVISRYSDDSIIENIISLPMCSYDRHYIADNLHHDVFTLYY